MKKMLIEVALSWMKSTAPRRATYRLEYNNA